MKKLMTAVLNDTKAAAMLFVAASIAAGSFPANAQSSVRDVANIISGMVDALREGHEQSAAPMRIKEIFALANKAARADDNVNFCGFFMGMSRQDANALAEYYGLKDGECRFDSESEKAVWRIHFSLKGVRRVTKGGNTFAELAQAVANRVGNMEGRVNLLTDERWYERKTIDGIVIRIHDSEGLTIQQESARRKMPIETATVRAGQRSAQSAQNIDETIQLMIQKAKEAERLRIQEAEEAERLMIQKAKEAERLKVAEAERQKAEREALRKAAEQGDARAQTELGSCYYEGKGVARNKEEAVRWYRKAAEQGFAAAQDALDECAYDDGRIPDGARRVKNMAFADRTDLTSVTIPDGVTAIGDCAFCDCTSLTNVTIPASVTNIGYSAFYGCSSLTSVTIPDGVTAIGDCAFCDCTSLTNVTIGNDETSVGKDAFKGCLALKVSYPFPRCTKSVYDGDDGGSGIFQLLVIAIVVGVTLVVLKRRRRRNCARRSQSVGTHPAKPL